MILKFTTQKFKISWAYYYFLMNIDQKEQNGILKLGYWPLRGRAQVARLILQYLNSPYENIIFNNKLDWEKYKEQHFEKYPLLQLPFLIDGDLVITQAVPICCYLIRKSKKMDLLGRNLKDISILNMYTWSIDNLGVALVKLCWMPGKPEKIEEMKAKFWELNVKQKVDRLQKFACHKPWMLGYLSLFDFSIYELIHYIQIIFPKQIQDYRKLLQIQQKIGRIPQIKKYESSSRAIKSYLPSNVHKKSKK